MVAKELADYVKERRAERYSDDNIRTVLLNAGYDRATIEEALHSEPIAPPPSSTPSIQVQSTSSIKPISTTSGTSTGGGGKKWAIVIAIVVVLLGGGTAFAYFNNYLGFGSTLSPDQVLANMYAAAPNIKTVQFSGTVTSTIYLQQPTSTFPAGSASFLSNFPTSTSISMTMAGETDLSDPANINQSSTITASGNFGGQAYSGAAEFISLGKVYYVKLDNITIGTSTAPNPISSMTAFFVGQWFKIDPVELAQTFAAGQTSQIAQIESSTALTATEIQQLRTDAMQDQIISVSQTLPNETIDGQEMYHYKLAVNIDNLKTFMTTAMNTIYGASSTIATAQAQEQALSSLNNIQFQDLEIWIGTKDFLPYQFTGDITESLPSSSEPVLDMSMSMQSGKYNQPLTITAPADSKDVATILQGFVNGSSLGTSFGSTSTVGGAMGSSFSRDTQRISDLHETQNALELYFNKVGSYPIASTWSAMETDIVNANVGLSAADILNDPSPGKTFYYQDFSGGSTYVVGAKLENANSALTNTPPSAGIPKGMSTCTAASKEYCTSL